MTERMISHYRIIEKVGEGGMGVVYRAEDSRLEREVALKFISSSRLSSPKSRAQLYREARAAASLEHENICSIHEIVEDDESVFIVMSFCDGPSLRDVLDEGPLPPPRAAELMKQVAEGLRCAHGHGIVHRDIKPSNILLDRELRRAKIMDFGLAKYGSSDRGTSTTSQGGTLEYVSPEQIENAPVDHRTDIWSLGVTFYEAMTGKRPFKGQYKASVIYSILNDEPDFSLIPEEPPGPSMSRIIARCLAREPEDRYQSADDVIRDLENVINGKGLSGLREAGTAAKRPWYAVRPAFLFMLAILLIPLGIWVVSVSRRHTGPGAGGPGDEAGGAVTDASMLYERGRTAYEAGDHKKGITLIEEAVAVDPDHIEGLKTLAAFYNSSGDSKRAASYIERAKKIAISSGNSIDLLKCNIVESYVWHEWDRAIRNLRALIAEEPDDPRSQLNMGFIFSRYIGRFDSALVHFRKAIALDPDNRTGIHGPAWNYIGNALLYSGDYDGAFDALGRYRDILPSSPDPGISLAGGYLFCGEYEKAIGLVEEAIESGDRSFKYFEVLGGALLSTGRWRRAVDAFNQYIGACETKGFQATGHVNLAMLYLVQMDGSAMESEIEALLSCEPSSVRASWLEGLAALRLDGDLAAAERHLETMRNIMARPFVFDGETEAAHLEGLILVEKGNIRKGIESLKHAELSSPRQFYYYGKELLGASIRAGRMETARAEYDRLSALNENDPEFLILSYELNRMSGERIAAEERRRRLFEVLSGADPDYVPLRDFISKYGGMTAD